MKKISLGLRQKVFAQPVGVLAYCVGIEVGEVFNMAAEKGNGPGTLQIDLSSAKLF
jgi:hypothetical protein